MSAPGSNRLPILATQIAQAHAVCRRSTMDLIRQAIAHPGFTHVTVVDRDTWEASGFMRPMRNNAIEEAIRTVYHSSMPATWATWKSARHRTNPWLVGTERVARPDQVGLIEEIIAAANRKLDVMGYTGPREIFPEEARP